MSELGEHGCLIAQGRSVAKTIEQAPPGARRPEDLVAVEKFTTASSPFFYSLSKKSRNDIGQVLKHVALRSGTVLFNVGDEARYLYIVATGTVRLSCAEKLINDDQSGQFLDEIEPSIFDMQASSLDCISFHHLEACSLTGAAEKESDRGFEHATFKPIVKGVRGEIVNINQPRASSKVALPSLSSDHWNTDSFRMDAAKQVQTGTEQAINVNTSLQALPLLSVPSNAGNFEATTDRVAKLRLGPRLGMPLTEFTEACACSAHAAKLHCGTISKNDSEGNNESSFGEEFNIFAKRLDAICKDIQSQSISAGKARPPEALKASRKRVGLLLSRDNLTDGDLDHSPPDPSTRGVSAAVEDTASSRYREVELGPGQVLGLCACIQESPYDVTVVATADSVLLQMTSRDLKHIVSKEKTLRRTEIASLLKGFFPSARSLDAERLDRLADCFSLNNYRRGSVLCRAGDTSEARGSLELLVIGEATVQTTLLTNAPGGRSAKLARDVGVLLPGQVINGSSQLLNVAEPFSIVVKSAEATTMRVSRKYLNKLSTLGVLHELKAIVENEGAFHHRRAVRLEEGVALNASLKQDVLLGATPLVKPQASIRRDIHKVARMWRVERHAAMGIAGPSEPRRGITKQLANVDDLVLADAGAPHDISIKPSSRCSTAPAVSFRSSTRGTFAAMKLALRTPPLGHVSQAGRRLQRSPKEDIGDGKEDSDHISPNMTARSGSASAFGASTAIVTSDDFETSMHMAASRDTSPTWQRREITASSQPSRVATPRSAHVDSECSTTLLLSTLFPDDSNVRDSYSPLRPWTGGLDPAWCFDLLSEFRKEPPMITPRRVVRLEMRGERGTIIQVGDCDPMVTRSASAMCREALTSSKPCGATAERVDAVKISAPKGCCRAHPRRQPRHLVPSADTMLDVNLGCVGFTATFKSNPPRGEADQSLPPSVSQVAIEECVSNQLPLVTPPASAALRDLREIFGLFGKLKDDTDSDHEENGFRWDSSGGSTRLDDASQWDNLCSIMSETLDAGGSSMGYLAKSVDLEDSSFLADAADIVLSSDRDPCSGEVSPVLRDGVGETPIGATKQLSEMPRKQRYALRRVPADKRNRAWEIKAKRAKSAEVAVDSVLSIRSLEKFLAKTPRGKPEIRRTIV